MLPRRRVFIIGSYFPLLGLGNLKHTLGQHNDERVPLRDPEA